MDISTFMSWFVSQVVNMFSWAYNLLDSLTFAGTSVLKVLVTIMVLVPLLSIVLTLFQNMSVVGEKSGRVSERREQKRAKDGKSRWI